MQAAKRHELLGLLQSDSRLSSDQMAAMLSESVAAVERKIATLQEERVVLRYGAVVDWERAGVERATALIDVKIHPQRDVGFDQLAERIARFAEVKSCYLMSGTYDLLL